MMLPSLRICGERAMPVEAWRLRQGPDGTALRHCVKIRLPPPNGKFGMVFRIERQLGRSVLVFAAFGVRHHPREANAPTVYEIAHDRLQSS